MTRSLMLAAALAAATFTTSCSSESEPDGVTVVSSVYPLQYVTERIAGDHADVESLTTPGVEPHDVELTVAQTATVIDADVVVHLSGFQSAVDGAVEQSKSDHVVDAGDSADLVEAGDHEHDHEHEHSGEVEGEESDPHFWLDPTRLAAVAADVEAALSAADPGNADAYASNLADLQRDLTALDSEISEGLATCARDTVVVSHNAFQYWADRYGMDMHAIAGLSPGAEPSPAHLAELQELIADEGITTVFTETLASPEMAQTLAADLGIETAVLDPIEGLSDETADEDYLSLMRANLAALQEANGCR